uniref:Uncharacterized protein n=1 Tax=Ditylenchus dipsaci TaxID=166011 RepID=A0A915CVU9_9BILA
PSTYVEVYDQASTGLASTFNISTMIGYQQSRRARHRTAIERDARIKTQVKISLRVAARRLTKKNISMVVVVAMKD